MIQMKNFFNSKSTDEWALLEGMRGAGCRITQPRRAVVAVLAEAEGWLVPERIWQRAQAHAPGISLVTVYRTLNLLVRLGFVRRVHQSDGCQGYIRAQPRHSHHLVCEGCQGVVEFQGTEDLSSLIQNLEGQTGFQVNAHVLEFRGLCPNCQKHSP